MNSGTWILALGWLAPSLAVAQATELPAPWTVHDDVARMSDIVALACAGDHVFVRSWHGRVARWDGSQFLALPPLDERRYGRNLAATASGHVFTQATDTIAEWDGREWSFHPFDDPADLGALFAVSDARVYAAARGRIVARRGGRFSSFDAGTWRDLSAIGGRSHRDLWVVGQGGAVLHFDGRRWSPVASGTGAWLRGVSAIGSSVYAWGDGATLLRFDGRAWTSLTAGLDGQVTGIGGAPGSTYAVGSFGIARLEGERWRIEIPMSALAGVAYELVGVCATARHVFVAESGGAVFVRTRS